MIGLIHNRLYRSIANQKVHINMVARLDQSDVINWLKQTIENDYCKMQTITN